VVGMADGYARPPVARRCQRAHHGRPWATPSEPHNAGQPHTAGDTRKRRLPPPHRRSLLEGLVGLARGTGEVGSRVRHPDELGTVLAPGLADAATPPRTRLRVAAPGLSTSPPMPPPRPFQREPAVGAGGLDELAALLGDTTPGRLGIVAGEEVGTLGATTPSWPWPNGLEPGARRALCRCTCSHHPSPVGLGPHLPGDAIRAPWAATTDPRRRRTRPSWLPYSAGPRCPTAPSCSTWRRSLRAGSHHPVRFGTAGDPAPASSTCLPSCPNRRPPPPSWPRATRAADVERFETLAFVALRSDPMHPMAAVHALLRALPTGTRWVDEAITSGRLRPRPARAERPGSYFFCRGAASDGHARRLWDLPGPRRAPVLCSWATARPCTHRRRCGPLRPGLPVGSRAQNASTNLKHNLSR